MKIKEENWLAEKALLTLQNQPQAMNNPRWVEVIKEVENGLSEKRRVFLKYRREAERMAIANGNIKCRGKHEWTGYVQCKYAEWYSKKNGIDIMPPMRQTLWKWMKDIVEITVRTAIRKGAL